MVDGPLEACLKLELWTLWFWKSRVCGTGDMCLSEGVEGINTDAKIEQDENMR